MKFAPSPITRAFILAAYLLPGLGIAGLPSGSLQMNVNGPTNRVWDASSIDELQHVEFGISEESTEIAFAAPFIQTGAGKLVGAGLTEMDVISPVFVGLVDAVYKVSGTINSAKGVARLTFTATAKGPAEISGVTRALSGTLAVKVTVDSLQQTASGVYTSTGAASGYGAIKEVGPLDFTWTDVVNSMGDGSWSLDLQLTNDGVKKIGGSAIVTLSSGAELEFTVKGTYNSKTDGSVLVLVAAPSSKGSTLKVNLTGSTITAIQGKVSGQTVKWKQ